MLADDRRDGQQGQAAVSLITVLPVFGIAALLLAALVLTGGAAWSAADASRAAARAAYVGEDPRRAARRASFAGWAGRPRVSRRGAVAHVRVTAPRVPLLAHLLPPLQLRARSSLGPSREPGR